MLSDNALFPVVSLRRESSLLMFQIAFGGFFKGVLAWRRVSENPRLLDAQPLGRKDLLRLRDVRRVRLAIAPMPLRVRPGNPEPWPILALIHAVSFLGCLLRHYLLVLLRTIPPL